MPSRPESPGAAPFPAGLVDPLVMERIGHLELYSRMVVDGLLAGKHRSTTKGGCCEFAEHRQYAAGDDVRHIDWQVYSRNDRYFIRRFEEETNLHGMLLLDTSGSMAFGLSTISKLDYARKAAACLARLLLHQRDAVGLATLHETRPAFVPARQSAIHLQAILSSLQHASAGGRSQLAAGIRACIPRLRRKGLFIAFSDCFCDLDELGKSLKQLRARGHDVVVMQILAPEEVTFDFKHWTTFQSLEDSGTRIHLDPPAIREEYLHRLREFLERIEQIVVGVGGNYVRMTTDRNLAEELEWFLRRRLARG